MNTKNKRLVFILCVIFLFSSGNLLSQMKKITQPRVYTEGNFYEQNSKLYTDAIVVKFRNKVIHIPKSARYATKSDIGSDFSAVKSIVERFEQKFESLTIVKQIPNAQWAM